jgi:hypothetical protein
MGHDFLDCLKIPGVSARRRTQPRIPSPGAFCTEISDWQERYSILSDVSATGLRLHRPYSGVHSSTVQLEFDLPGVDELIWASGVVCFDSVWWADGRLLHTSGIEIQAAAGRHLKMLREYAFDRAPRFAGYADRRGPSRV